MAKLRKIKKGGYAVSLDALQAATNACFGPIDEEKLCGDDPVIKCVHTEMTVQQKKLFIALCAIASLHAKEYMREYINALYDGKTQWEAVIKASEHDIDVTFDELCALYFKDESKDNGTRNRAKVVQIINELRGYFYSYAIYSKTEIGIEKEEITRRLVDIQSVFYKKRRDGTKRMLGAALTLSPYMFSNNLYGIHTTKEDLRYILTDVCGNSPVRTTAAIKLLAATGEYCSNPNSIFRRNGYRIRLATIAGVSNDEFDRLNCRKQSSIKLETIKAFRKLGVETDQISYDKAKRIITVNIDGLERIRQKYIGNKLKYENVKDIKVS